MSKVEKSEEQFDLAIYLMQLLTELEKDPKNLELIYSKNRNTRSEVLRSISYNLIQRFRENNFNEVSDDHIQTIQKVLLWVPTLTGSSEWVEKCKTLVREGKITKSTIGLASSILGVFLSNQEEKKKEEELIANWAPPINEYLPHQEKTRVNLKVKVYKITPKVTDYGYIDIIKMIDDQGHRLVWFASSEPDIQVGDVLEIRGTIKSKKEFKNNKITTLSRVKVIKKIQ